MAYVCHMFIRHMIVTCLSHDYISISSTKTDFTEEAVRVLIAAITTINAIIIRQLLFTHAENNITLFNFLLGSLNDKHT